MRSLVTFAIVCGAVSACPRYRPEPPEIPCGVTSIEQAIYVPPPAGIQLALEDGTRCTPGDGDECAEEFETCDVRVGDVLVGSIARQVVTIRDPRQSGLLAVDVRLDSTCRDLYIEGFTDRVGEEFEVSLVVNATSVGACNGRLAVISGAENIGDDGEVSVDVLAERVAGGDEGCRADAACCCPVSGDRTLPECVDERLSCAQGLLFFGDRCDEICDPPEDP